MTLFFPPSLRGFVARRVVQSTWTDHLCFAYDLVGAARPRLLVELGTQRGLSYFGFCQSVREHELYTKCYAVDSWEGDDHSGRYEVETYDGRRAGAQVAFNQNVFADVEQYNKQYAAFSTLMRMRFDEALEHFEDGSISILHIDGCHTYDAVRADFEKWYPKVEPGGVILFHDVTARLMDFGVWRFWQETAPKFESFTFRHCYGLGVLRKPGGDRAKDAPLLKLLFCGDTDVQERLRAFYVHAAEFQPLARRRVGAKRLVERVRKKRLVERLARRGPGRVNVARQPELSIILVVDGRSKSAEDCIYSLSAAHQSNVSEASYELVVVENPSDDELGEERAHAWGDNVRYIRRERRASSAACLGLGLQHARGPWIAVAKATQRFTPGIVEQTMLARNISERPVLVVPEYRSEPRAEAPPRPGARPKPGAPADWKVEGYALFDTGRFGPGNERGFLNPLADASFAFFRRADAGGALDQLETSAVDDTPVRVVLRALSSHSGGELVVLAGEGGFEPEAPPRDVGPMEPVCELEPIVFGFIPGQAQPFVKESATMALASRGGVSAPDDPE